MSPGMLPNREQPVSNTRRLPLLGTLRRVDLASTPSHRGLARRRIGDRPDGIGTQPASSPRPDRTHVSLDRGPPPIRDDSRRSSTGLRGHRLKELTAIHHRSSTLARWGKITQEARSTIKRMCHSSSLRIDDVASHLKISRRNLQRALANASTDFSRELHEARMDRSAKLLAQHYSVSTSAHMSGYRSASHFSLVFRQHFDVTPQHFRRALKINRRLQWRTWNDEVNPVQPGCHEYFRRRRRWNEDQRTLHRLVKGMSAMTQSALSANLPPPRHVFKEFGAVASPTHEPYAHTRAAMEGAV